MEKVPPQVCFNSQDGNWKDNVSQTSDSITSSMNSSLKAGIDNFVDKLEKLMAARSRQYEERVKMEKEREKRKKERREKRPQTRRSRRSERDKNRRNDRKYQALPDTEDNEEDSFTNEDIELCESITNNKQKRYTSTAVAAASFSPNIQTTDAMEPIDDTNNLAKTNGEEKKSDITTQIDDLLNLMTDDCNDEGKKNAASPTGIAIESTPETLIETSHQKEISTITSPDPLLDLVSNFDNSNVEAPQKELTLDVSSVTLMTGSIPTKDDEGNDGSNNDTTVKPNEMKPDETTNDTITKSPGRSKTLLSGNIPTVIVDDDNVQIQKDNSSTTNENILVQNDMNPSSPTNVNLHENSALRPIPVTPSPPPSPQTKIADDSLIKLSDTDTSDKMIPSVVADSADENHTLDPESLPIKVVPVDVDLSKKDSIIDLNLKNDSSIQTPTSGASDYGINTSLSSKGEGKEEVSDIISGDHTAKQVETSTQ